MEQLPLFFSLLFFCAFAIYLFSGAYMIHINPKAALNRVFLAICVSLCFWSLGFAIANSAPTVEMCILWRRVSAVGWGTIYSLLLHFLLLLTGGNRPRKWRGLRWLLHLPAVVCIYVFAISKEIAVSQYNLVKMDSGWINVSQQDGWSTFFNIYYISYVLAGLAILWHWRRSSAERTVRRQANLLFLSIITALLLGSLTDVVLSSTLRGPVPQMAPVFTLFPVGAIYYCMRRYSLMKKAARSDDELILNSETRLKLYNNLAFAFFIGAIATGLVYFLPHMVHGEENMKSMLYTSGLLFFLGGAILLAQFIKGEKVKETVIVTAMLFSIPVITLQFIEYASITVWVFPLVLMVTCLLFNTRVPLILLTVVSIATQLLVWLGAPREAIKLDEFDYVIRASIFGITFLVGSFVNRTYVKRMKENTYQINFQALISSISSEFVSISQGNLDEKINTMLDKVGRFFQVDRTYIFLIDQQQQTMTYAYEWCNEGITPETEAIQDVPLDVFPWWMEGLNANKLVYIEDVSKLPAEASAEKAQLSQQGVKSAVVIPIEENGVMLGFMGLDSVAAIKKWSGYHIDLLKILSNLLTDGFIKIRSEKAIKYMAYYDHLTGLPNRTLFSDRLVQAIHLAQRNGRFVGVVFVDLDSFKTINDTMGHSGGDAILKEVAKSLTQRLRKTDTVARFGGDEFLILANNLTDDADMIKVTDNIMEMFEHPFHVNGQEFFITGSAGVAVYPFDGEDAETLVKNADIAMYIAKERGKNQYILCTNDMKEEVKKNIKLSNHLHRVQERNELAVYYQPQVRLSTGEIVGLEALLRWRHPDMGMIPPNVFIPLAEMNGTINTIGEWVLETVIHQNKRWQQMGFPHLRIAVNLSVIQFSNPNFVSNVDRLLKEAGLHPKYLELEITESFATKEAAHIVEALNKLKQLGVSISIDDFGTEYSSLNRLKALPIDRIKIDMQFIQGIEGSEKDQAITKVIINLAKSLGLEVLAEGVETMPQLEFLNQKMCDDVQGFYYYKPMPTEEIEKLFRSFHDNPVQEKAL